MGSLMGDLWSIPGYYMNNPCALIELPVNHMLVAVRGYFVGMMEAVVEVEVWMFPGK